MKFHYLVKVLMLSSVMLMGHCNPHGHGATLQTQATMAVPAVR